MDIGRVGTARSPVAVVLLSVITLGIYSLYWQYSTFKELKAYAGVGIGGGLGLLFAFLLGVVNVFLLPHEIGRLYATDGQAEPVTALTGFWLLLPLIDWFVWVFKCQGRLSEFWQSHRAEA